MFGKIFTELFQEILALIKRRVVNINNYKISQQEKDILSKELNSFLDTLELFIRKNNNSIH